MFDDVADVSSLPAQAVVNRYDGISTGDLMAERRAIADQLDALDAERSMIVARKDSLDSELLTRADIDGVRSYTGDGCRVNVMEIDTVKYDPAKWDDIVKELVRAGHSYCIQRRLTASKIQAILASGERLPDGLEMGSVKQVRFTRTNK